MKLLIINQFASTPEYSSGAGERFYYLAKEFGEHDIQSTIVSASFNHLFLKYPPNDGKYTIEESEGAKFIWVKTRKYSAKSNIGRVWSFFEFLFKLFFLPGSMIGRPDIVLVSSMSIFPVYYALYLKWRYKIPFVLEIRDIWPLTPIEIGGYSPSNPFMKLIDFTARLGYKKADYIVSVLPDFDRFLKDNKISYKGFKWIPNGVQISPQVRKHESKTQSERFVVTYAGAIGEANALEYFIEAAKLFVKEDNIEFWVIGSGPEKEGLLEAAKDHPWIRFFEKVPKAMVQELLNKSDCCYHGCRAKALYKYGISPNKYNDYMLSGIPMISSSNVPKDPVVISNCGIQVEAENVEALYEGIMIMKNSTPFEREIWGRNGRQYVTDFRNYKKLAQDYRSVFNKLEWI